MKKGYVYILTNKNNTVIYTGVTSMLEQRIWQHKNQIIEGFTKKYNCQKLVWFEVSEEIVSAIAREKQIKSWSRKKKVTLINDSNPEWVDLAPGLFGN
ncbi:MAG: GIY-YIG nuclease family protein [Aestuariibacter sp.]|nr:GIY-YIG nuclease family protein [Aestuariibacter sp.]